MDKKYIEDVIGWDVRNWSKSLVFWNKYLPEGVEFDTALELGAHNGGISLWLAGKSRKVICSDLENSFEDARILHKKYGLAEKISYKNIDATDIPYENEFNLICFKSILGGIGRNKNIKIQKQTINEIYKALKPGGYFLFAENLQASPIHFLLRKTFTQWGSEWRYVNIPEMEEFVQEFSEYHYRTFGFVGAFGRNETQRRFLSAFDSALFNCMIPEAWRYIIVGVAKK
jgi:SAM-dependent methyltransferase